MVSIIVPIYNVESYLPDCINSIQKSTYINFQLILVDDGSTDSSGAICDCYAASDSRIQVIHTPNRGVSAARNLGLDVANGEYIMFVDSDDWISPETLEEMISLLENASANMAICGFQIVNDIADSGNVQNYCFGNQVLLADDLVKSQTSADAWIYTSVWAKLYTRKVFDTIRFPEGYIYEDSAVWHRILGVCQTVALTDHVFYSYRKRFDSITTSDFSIKKTDHLSAWADRICFTHAQGWESWKQATIKLYTGHFFEYYFRFRKTEENELYFIRMEQSLEKVLLYILRAKNVSLKHKFCFYLFNLNPAFYTAIRKRIRHR